MSLGHIKKTANLPTLKLCPPLYIPAAPSSPYVTGDRERNGSKDTDGRTRLRTGRALSVVWLVAQGREERLCEDRQRRDEGHVSVLLRQEGHRLGGTRPVGRAEGRGVSRWGGDVAPPRNRNAFTSKLSSTNCKVTTTKGESDMTKARDTKTVVVDMGGYRLSRIRRHAGSEDGTGGVVSSNREGLKGTRR